MRVKIRDLDADKNQGLTLSESINFEHRIDKKSLKEEVIVDLQGLFSGGDGASH